MRTTRRERLGAVVLTGGTGARMGGADKAALEVAGMTLLERALAATSVAAEVVVVGEPVPTARPVTWTREDPPGGGPAAGVLAALDAFVTPPTLVAVLAVDMPLVTGATLGRLRDAVGEQDGAVLVDHDGRRQPLCGVYRSKALAAARPRDPRGEQGLAVRRLLTPLALAEVPALGDEARDVDTWEDLRRLDRARDGGLRDPAGRGEPGEVNLHDWIDELMDALDIEAEIDEGLVLEVAREAAHRVVRPAAPISTYLLGYAAGLAGGSPEKVEELAGRVLDLAERWEGGEDPEAQLDPGPELVEAD